MPLNTEDAIAITRYLETLLRDRDPYGYQAAAVTVALEREADPRRNLLTLLDVLMRMYSERSSRLAEVALDRINRYARRSDRQPITGIAVDFSPAERNLYGVEQIDLMQLPDRSGLVHALREVFQNIVEDLEQPL